MRHTPKYSPWQQAVLDVAKNCGTVSDVARRIRAQYPECPVHRSHSAAREAISVLERQGIVKREDERVMFPEQCATPDDEPTPVQQTVEVTCSACDGDGKRGSRPEDGLCRCCHGSGTITKLLPAGYNQLA